MKKKLLEMSDSAFKKVVKSLEPWLKYDIANLFMEQEGKDFDPNDRTGLRILGLLLSAAEEGDSRAMVSVALLYDHLADHKEATVTWLKNAVDAGNEDAVLELVDFYHRRGEHDEAQHWLEKVWDSDDPRVMVRIGCMFHEGAGGLPVDHGMARRYFEKAAATGNIFSE